MKIFIGLAIMILLKVGTSTLSTVNEVKMIVDIVKSYNKPSAVVAYVCWQTTRKVYLMNLLRKGNNPKSIRFLHETTDYNPKEDIIIVTDINCPSIGAFFIQASANLKFSNHCRWIIVGKSINENNAIIPHELNDLNIFPDSEVIIPQSIDTETFKLDSIYKIKPGNTWLLEHFGNWSVNFGLNKSKDMIISTAVRRKNFAKESIVTSIIISDNRTMYDLNDLRNSQIDSVSKANFRHMTPLYDYINATRILIFTKTWGYFINGSWNGMIGHLVNGEAELAGSVSFITKQRLDVLYYLSHPTSITVKFVFREPPLSYQNNLFLLPFKASVWYCIAAFVLLLIFILYINAQWETRKSENNNMKKLDQTALTPNVSDIAILVISAMSQQGSSVELKGTLGRLVLFILFVTFLFLYTSYSASIVALLQSSSNQIRTLSDLLHSKLELGVEDTPYNRHLFSTATESLRKAIYQTKIAPRGSKPHFLSIEEGIQKLQKKPFAFNMNIGVGYKIIQNYFHEHEKCGLQEIEYIQDNIPLLSCRKQSSYKEIFKIGLFRIQEHGLNDRVNRLIYSKKPICSVRGGSFGSVNMMDCYPVFMMLLFGTVLAFVSLLIEIIIHRLHHKINQHTTQN